ncbi:MAG TPA: hypothetical protein VMT61_06890 [Candidatus Binataceae bacterium]|nr:hypothetical protein [Candidatus Binataceae bacterium]
MASSVTWRLAFCVVVSVGVNSTVAVQDPPGGRTPQLEVGANNTAEVELTV